MANLDEYFVERKRLHEIMATESVDKVLQWYDDCAELYENNIRSANFSFHAATVEATMEYVKTKNALILDVGAGTGTIGEMLKEKGYTTIDAHDGSQAMLDIAMKKNIYRKHFCSFIGTEPIKDLEEGSYDALVSAGVFAHGAVYYESIPVLMNCLKKGGYLIFEISKLSMDTSPRLTESVLTSLAEEWKKNNICSMATVKDTFHINKDPAFVYIFTRL